MKTSRRLTLIVLTIFSSAIHVAQSLGFGAAGNKGLATDWKKVIRAAHNERYQDLLREKKQLEQGKVDEGEQALSVDQDERRNIILMMDLAIDLDREILCYIMLNKEKWDVVKQDFERENLYNSFISTLPFFPQRSSEDLKVMFFLVLDLGYNAEKNIKGLR